jgi:hypothetical protein
MYNANKKSNADKQHQWRWKLELEHQVQHPDLDLKQLLKKWRIEIRNQRQSLKD